MKVKIKYIGKHQPQEIVEREKSLAEALVKTGNYEFVIENENEHSSSRDKRSVSIISEGEGKDKRFSK